MDLSIYKVDLDTDQPNGGKGESPRSAFTKYNNSLDTINSELTALGENVDTINDELTTLDDSAMKKADNLSGLIDKETARSNLGLGGAATRDVGEGYGDVMEVGAFGLGARTVNNNSNFQALSRFNPRSLPTGYPGNAYEFGVILRIFHGYLGDVFELVPQHTANSPLIFRNSREDTWKTIYHTGNTTVDSNGFIKAASPILKLFSDRIEKTEHLEIAEAEFERLGVGHYVLHNVPPLSKDGWYIETPKDRNSNIYFYLDCEEDEDSKTLTIKTYEPDYSTGRAEAGAPMDILEGRFISLRFAEDPSLYPAPEMQEDTPEETEEIEPAI